MEEIVIVIPARYASTRFPGKPLKLINSKPMIYWTYMQAKKVPNVSRVIVATESEKIVEKCEEFGMEVMLTSDKHLTGTDRLAEVAEKIPASMYVNVQGDEPMIEPEVISKMIDFLKENPDYLCATIRSTIDDPRDAVNTTVSKVVTDFNDDIMYISKQPIPYPKASLDYKYYKALGIYAFRPEVLDIYRNNTKATYENVEDIELLRLVERGIKIRDIIVESNSPSVDTPKDLVRVEMMMNRSKE